MDKSVNIFPSPYELAKNFAGELVTMINNLAKKSKTFSVALSGGTTPELLFSFLGDHFSKSAPWEIVHFFWGDERCVAPHDTESNYGMANRKLFEKINIPSDNIHRIKGEDDPEQEAIRYSGEISDYLVKRDGLPRFDLIILGLGEDGHTASIFPGQEELFASENICKAVIHPVNRKKRITITGRVINNADSVAFLVTGERKAEMVEKIINKSVFPVTFPASHVEPEYGMLRWFIDEAAGSLL